RSGGFGFRVAWAPGETGPVESLARVSQAIPWHRPPSKGDRAGRARHGERHGDAAEIASRLGQIADAAGPGTALRRCRAVPSSTGPLLPQGRLVIEYDGSTHRDSLTADNRRQKRLIDARDRLQTLNRA